MNNRHNFCGKDLEKERASMTVFNRVFSSFTGCDKERLKVGAAKKVTVLDS